MRIECSNIFNLEGLSLPIDAEFTFSKDAFCNVSGGDVKIHVKGEIRNATGIVTLKANAGFTLVTQCDRCAAELTKEMNVPMEHILVQQLNNEEHDEFLVVPDAVLLLDELVLADVLLQMPAKILCKEDCKGLCVQCGKNLNEGPCGCQKPIDPRLEALRQLLDN